MNQNPHRLGNTIKEQKPHENAQNMAKFGNDYYEGDIIYSEYSKVISDLLKDPVSLGIVGGNSIRGHQR
jgi:hypothetical protein